MGIAVLGPLQVDGGTGALARRDRVVLAVLAMRTGELVSADQLADALWSEGPPATWNKALQGSVVRLRKLLGASTIETVDHGYRLTLPPSDVDAHEFERLVGRARELVELGEPERAAYVLGEGTATPVFLDDQALLLPYPDGSTYVWDTSPQYAVDTACRIVGRGLTREEWREAFGDRPYEDVCG